MSNRITILAAWISPAMLVAIALAVTFGWWDHPGKSEIRQQEVPEASSTESLTPVQVEVFRDIIKTEFVPVPPGGGPPGSRWLRFILAAESAEDGGSLHAEWQAYLVQAAMAEKASPPDNLRQAIAGSTMILRSADGRTEEIPGGSTDAPSGQQFGKADYALLARTVSAAAANHHVSVNRFEILHPLGDALDLAVTASDPAFGEDDLQAFLRESTAGQASLEGVYAEVRNLQGKALRRVGSVARGRVGLSWADSSFVGGERNVLPNIWRPDMAPDSVNPNSIAGSVQ